MDAIFRADSYHFDMLSVPFIVASAVNLAVIIYVSLVRGVAVLRFALLFACSAVFLWDAGLALIGSTTNTDVAVWISRVNVAALPLAGPGVLVFLLALANRLPQHRVLVAVAFVSSSAIALVCVATDWVVAGVWRTPSGLLYHRVHLNGIAQTHTVLMGLWVAVGILLVWRRIGRETSAVRRRQLKGSIIAFGVASLGMVDVPLGLQFGWFPVSWLFLTIGLLLAFRLLIVVDLLGVVSLDRRVPLLILYLAAVVAGVWLALRAVGPSASVLVAAAVVLGAFMSLRVIVGLTRAVGAKQREDKPETPLDRALVRYAESLQSLRTERDIARATVELVELTIGCQSRFLVPSSDDYSWLRLDGEGTETLPETATPDPIMLSWLEEHAQPIARDDLAAQRLADLREPIERLFESHGAAVLVPLLNRDEVVGMLALHELETRRALKSDERRLLERTQEHAAAALVYARMYEQATTRVEMDKEVGLAAAVQKAFIPRGELLEVADMSFSGLYAPASKVGGDWWSVHELPDERVLLLIGDVTGHGIPAAMVTAAAKGCYDVAQRLMSDEFDVVRLLDLLDDAVRKAGGNQFYMTCFATLLDPPRKRVTYANAGHVVPYLCRSKPDGTVALDALVARGNPLGAVEKAEYQSTSRELRSGDILVWYTDGIVECTNPLRRQFGDRRMQRLLRRVDAARATVQGVRNDLARAAIAFQEGHPADDDITLVVGRVA